MGDIRYDPARPKNKVEIIYYNGRGFLMPIRMKNGQDISLHEIRMVLTDTQKNKDVLTIGNAQFETTEQVYTRNCVLTDALFVGIADATYHMRIEFKLPSETLWSDYIKGYFTKKNYFDV